MADVADDKALPAAAVGVTGVDGGDVGVASAGDAESSSISSSSSSSSEESLCLADCWCCRYREDDDVGTAVCSRWWLADPGGGLGAELFAALEFGDVVVAVIVILSAVADDAPLVALVALLLPVLPLFRACLAACLVLCRRFSIALQRRYKKNEAFGHVGRANDRRGCVIYGDSKRHWLYTY